MAIVINMGKSPVPCGKSTFIREMIAAMPDRKFLVVYTGDTKAFLNAWTEANPYGVLIYDDN